MINDIQEDEIRNFLSVITMKIQNQNSNYDDDLKRAVSRLVFIMNQINPNKVFKYSKSTVVEQEPKYKELANIILDMLDYSRNGRENFINKAVAKIYEK